MNRSIKILAFAIVVLAIVATIYSVVNAPAPTTTTTAISVPATSIVTTTINQNRYELPLKYLPNNGYYLNYTFDEAGSFMFPIGQGVAYTALTFYKNTSVVSSLDTPLQVYSIVKVCNSAANATQLFDTYKNTVLSQNVSLPTNTTLPQISLANPEIMQLPQIGDQTFGFLVVEKSAGMNLFISQFTTANVYVRIGVFEPLNSTSTAPLLNISRGMLATLQG